VKARTAGWFLAGFSLGWLLLLAAIAIIILFDGIPTGDDQWIEVLVP
jgi:hypothetical protein